MGKVLLFILCAVVLCACGRSPEEQTAYEHAEEQYRINQQNAERYRQAIAQGEEPVTAARRSER